MARLRDEGALSVSELSAPLSISRQAVTKHLNVLQEAGLIAVEWQGRERRHRLRAEPLKAIDDWLQPYAKAWDQALDRLRLHLGEDEQDTES